MRLVDRIEGGDSFAAVLIQRFVNGRDLEATQKFAVAASAEANLEGCLSEGVVMNRLWMTLRVIAALAVLTVSVSAQDYRARVQGTVSDSSSGALPGVTVTLINNGTAVTSSRVTDTQGRYVFDFVDPGNYSVTAELSGFKKADQRNVRVPQRGDVTANLTMEVGGVEETVVVEASPVAVQFNTSSSDITIERQLVDQVPINGRNPYSLASLDPTVNVTLASENRPYHHAYANDYDAGGGTRREQRRAA